MPQVDIWDVPAEKNHSGEEFNCGYSRDFDSRYECGDELGAGGFGKVVACIERRSGQVHACKVLPKKLHLPNVSPMKQRKHVENIQREVSVLRRLKGSLSVVQLQAVCEDASNVYIIMEKCSGGELWHKVGQRPYSERTVAKYMQSVLRTLVQCHLHGILHRDVKPGNFMLLDESANSPVKAIDFGLAVFYNEDELPLTDLGFDGTAWFMAPELLSSEAYPVSDVWAAGVMAFQLLSGFLPFDDHHNPNHASLSIIWKSILTDEPSFKRSCWNDVSDEAKDFIKKVLVKEPAQRPSAMEALEHPWLQADYSAGRSLQSSVVARIQQFAQRDPLQRSILQLIAHELLQKLPQIPRPASASPFVMPPVAEDGSMSSEPSAEPQSGMVKSPSCGSPFLWLASSAIHEGSLKGRRAFARVRSSSRIQANEQMKAGRISLDTSDSSRHAIPYMGRRDAVDVGEPLRPQTTSKIVKDAPQSIITAELQTSSKLKEPPLLQRISQKLNDDVARDASPKSTTGEAQRRGGSIALKELARSGPPSFNRSSMPGTSAPCARHSSQHTDAVSAPIPGDDHVANSSALSGAILKAGTPPASLKDKLRGVRDAIADDAHNVQNGSVHTVHSQRLMQEATNNDPNLLSFLVMFMNSDARLEEMRSLLRTLNLSRNRAVGTADFKAALLKMGYQISNSEAEALMRYISTEERVSKSQFIASQLDWRKLQENNREMWLECVRQTFANLDSDQDGIISSAELMRMLRNKLPDADIDLAVEEAMIQDCAEQCGMTFEDFVQILQRGELQGASALAAFDARWSMPAHDNDSAG